MGLLRLSYTDCNLLPDHADASCAPRSADLITVALLRHSESCGSVRLGIKIVTISGGNRLRILIAELEPEFQPTKHAFSGSL